MNKPDDLQRSLEQSYEYLVWQLPRIKTPAEFEKFYQAVERLRDLLVHHSRSLDLNPVGFLPGRTQTKYPKWPEWHPRNAVPPISYEEAYAILNKGAGYPPIAQ